MSQEPSKRGEHSAKGIERVSAASTDVAYSYGSPPGKSSTIKRDSSGGSSTRGDSSNESGSSELVTGDAVTGENLELVSSLKEFAFPTERDGEGSKSPAAATKKGNQALSFPHGGDDAINGKQTTTTTTSSASKGLEKRRDTLPMHAQSAFHSIDSLSGFELRKASSSGEGISVKSPEEYCVVTTPATTHPSSYKTFGGPTVVSVHTPPQPGSGSSNIAIPTPHYSPPASSVRISRGGDSGKAANAAAKGQGGERKVSSSFGAVEESVVIDISPDGPVPSRKQRPPPQSPGRAAGRGKKFGNDDDQQHHTPKSILRNPEIRGFTKTVQAAAPPQSEERHARRTVPPALIFVFLVVTLSVVVGVVYNYHREVEKAEEERKALEHMLWLSNFTNAPEEENNSTDATAVAPSGSSHSNQTLATSLAPTDVHSSSTLAPSEWPSSTTTTDTASNVTQAPTTASPPFTSSGNSTSDRNGTASTTAESVTTVATAETTRSP